MDKSVFFAADSNSRENLIIDYPYCGRRKLKIVREFTKGAPACAYKRATKCDPV